MRDDRLNERYRQHSNRCLIESAAKRVCHRRDAAFAEEDSLVRHAHACRAMHPSWFVFRVLCALGVSAVRFCSKVMIRTLNKIVARHTSCVA